MAALPWVTRQAIGANTEYVAMALRLPLKSFGRSPASSETP